jgi:murein L,D-transpeptidase YafK
MCAAGALLAGCDESSSLDDDPGRSEHPISSATLAEMAKIDTTPSSPLLIRAYKKEAELDIWKMKSDGRLRPPEDLSDVPLVGPARPEEARRRHAGA